MIQSATDILQGEIIQLNVGGVIMPVKKSILTQIPGSGLEAMFSGRHHLELKNNSPYLQRDPEVFRQLVSYLESDKTKMPKIND